MPRGIKKETNYEEEIQKTEARIIHHTNSIKELKERKQELEQQQKMKNFKIIENFMSVYNLTPTDLINLCSGKLSVSKQEQPQNA